jgi:hypothetical protein
MKHDGAEAAGSEPDWVMPYIDAVSEENWAEYEANGFEVLDLPNGVDPALLLPFVRRQYGTRNVFTGQSYDASAGRPLRTSRALASTSALTA